MSQLLWPFNLSTSFTGLSPKPKQLTQNYLLQIDGNQGDVPFSLFLLFFLVKDIINFVLLE